MIFVKSQFNYNGNDDGNNNFIRIIKIITNDFTDKSNYSIQSESEKSLHLLNYRYIKIYALNMDMSDIIL